MSEQERIVNAAFEQLDASIIGENYADGTDPLPGRVTAEDFMLMSLEPQDGCWHFKNIDTRNYIVVSADDGTIYVPRTAMPFSRGEF